MTFTILYMRLVAWDRRLTSVAINAVSPFLCCFHISFCTSVYLTCMTFAPPCIRTHDTGRNFEPIFMKFTRFVRVHSWLNPTVLVNNQPNGTTDMGENVPPKTSFSGLCWTEWVFLKKRTQKLYLVPHFPPKKLYSFLLSDAPFPQKWSCPQKELFAVILENIVFFEKVVKWKIFKTLMPTKKVTLILVARRPPPKKQSYPP